MNPAQSETRPGPPPAPAGQGRDTAPHASRITPHASRITLFFTHSAAALLLALASALFLINLTGPTHLVLPREPLSGISFRYVFWLFGGIAVLVAFLCLFSQRPARLIPWLAWLGANFLIYRIGLYVEGCHSLTGFLASAAYAFGIPAKTAAVLVDMSFGYLLLGSCAALAWQWRRSSKTQSLQSSATPSLHPSTTPFLKTSCFFCQGHIEFPRHAIGQKIQCPHCKMDITLKEPV
jgi:hypothetical protein